MRPLSALELLDAWERGLSKSASGRVLALLTAACPDYSSDAVAALNIGERDRWLLTLREWTFGSQLASVAHCSGCNERLEWTVNISDLRVAEKPTLSTDMSVEMDGYSANFRLPNSLDLEAIDKCPDAQVARGILLERCVSNSKLGELAIAVKELPVTVEQVIVDKMAEADPQVDMEFDLVCPACANHWQVMFDIESFFWKEITAWAGRILSEVHVLASAYGWREGDILNLSAWRRQYYLELVSG